MKKFFLFLAASVSCAMAADETIEPPLSYSLKVGSRSYVVEEGQEFQLGAVEGGTKAKLVADDHRVFTYQQVKFKYPRHFAFAANQEDPASLNWMLSGNTCILMLFSIEGKIGAVDFGDLMAAQFGKKNTKISEGVLKLGSKEREGKRLDVELVGSHLTQEILVLKSSAGRTKLLVLQDTLEEDGKHSAEYDALVKMLDGSFAEKED